MEHEPSPVVLGEREGMTGGPGAVLAAFRSQRHRFLATVAAWEPSAWNAPTRCTLWSAHDVVRHVRDVAALHVARLGGPPAPFRVEEPFSPPTSPLEWLTASAGQGPEETLRELRTLVEEEARLLEHRAGVDPTRPVAGQLRRQVHWSVAAAHTLWDAWMHERDIVLAMGGEPSCPADEFRVVLMYGLLAAAAPGGWEGRYIHTTVALEGSPDGVYEIAHVGDSIRVTSIPPTNAAELSGPAGEVLDSLAGRGLLPREVFASSAAVVDRLTVLREVAT
ncbi:MULTISPECIES: maleylpyruvate isomerase N-terminal domain-containing protein [Streptomyces]|uniref:maleylpyruvate isomerase N-terminal domain-containing protein n=1 Tax=Streptomyces TaxID=1883 RepID=UPI00240D2072|nr:MULTISPECIES: maleylpyruvate isomerase N-terminal domain-containing protein [Streptomyces]WFB88482.1 maleylpyruvate isomerase N-terminal domain-containing protein [Streptomyces olivaceus]WGK50925.1 maleylpyruvate isomerase N-terminal domain-containing protein [Streptomyces sp. B146]